MTECKLKCNCNKNGNCEVEQYERCGKYMAYQQGRADAIEEVLQKMKELKLDENCPSGCHCSVEQESCPYNECNNDVIRIVEQLKEQSNDK